MSITKLRIVSALATLSLLAGTAGVASLASAATTTTTPRYRLHALPGTTPPKPGLVRAAHGGSAIAVEVWDLPQRAIGSFLALIPPP